MKTKQKTLTLKDIKPYSERWENIKREVSKRINQDFNEISFDVYKKCLSGDEEGFIGDYVINPSEDTILNYFVSDYYKIDELLKEFLNCCDNFDYKDYNESDFKEWLKENKQDEINEFWTEIGHYPMWNTLFEAKDEFLSNKLSDEADEIYNRTHLGILSGNDYFNNLIFMSSAGHDFYESYWLPLYCDVFKWVDVNDFKGKITG